MIDMLHILNGVQTLSLTCPSDGTAWVDFEVHNEKILSARFTKSSEMVRNGRQILQEKVDFFKPLLVRRILNDVENLRMQYGTIRIFVEVKNGELKKYTVTPEHTLTANLLNAEIRSHANRQLKKQMNQSA